MRTRRWPALLGAMAAWASAWAVLIPAPAAQALAPDATGWWWLFEDTRSDTPRHHNTFGAGAMYVAAQPERTSGEETAVAALRLVVPDFTELKELVLVIDDQRSSPRTSIAVQACPTNMFWQEEEAGPIGSAPTGDCAAGSARGVVDADGKKARFAVGPLVKDGFLNIVLMPQTAASTPVPSTPAGAGPQKAGATAPFQVVFKKPDAGSISATTHPDPNPTPPPPPGGEPPPFFEEPGPVLPSTGGPAFYESALPPAAVAVSRAPASGPSRRIPVSDLAPGTRIVSDDERNRGVLLGLVLAGVVLVFLGLAGGGAGRRVPRVLGPIGRVLPEMEGEREAARGIGRFARPRTRPPLKL